MKVDLSSEELQVLMAPGLKAQEEVVRLTAEVERLNAKLALMAHPATASGVFDEERANQKLINALTQVCYYVSHGNKLSAIKFVRSDLGLNLGLKEAKDVVEGTYCGPGVSRIG